MINELSDPDLGKIQIIYNARAKRIIARRGSNIVQLTVPKYSTQNQIIKAFQELKPRILNLKSKELPLFTPEINFKTFSFQLHLKEHALANFYVTFKDQILSIAYPQNKDIKDDTIQAFIRKNIENALRLEAKRIIPDKIKYLSNLYGFTYNLVRINKSRSRWGSCSSKKDINISYFCLLLPEYLIDFVILHELCHTIEMNHGVKFWQLLDKVTNNNAKKLTSELNSTSIFW